MDKSIFHYEEAMQLIGNDREFLNEVLNDLMHEIDTSEDEFIQFLKKTIVYYCDYRDLWKIGYTTRSAAKYLCCDELAELGREIKELTNPYRNDKTEVPEEVKIRNKRLSEDFYNRFWLAKLRLIEELKKHNMIVISGNTD